VNTRYEQRLANVVSEIKDSPTSITFFRCINSQTSIRQPHTTPKTMDAPDIMMYTRENGISVITGTFFIIGDVVGAGIVALPYTMKLVSWWGVLLFFLGAFIMSLCGILLSHAYVLAFKDVKDRDAIRDPYPQIAEQAYGRNAKLGIIVMLNVSLVLVCVVFILLLGEIFSEFAPIHGLSHRAQMRIWFVVCAFVLIPLSMFGTPKDFWGIGVLASICSALAAVLICMNLAISSHRYGYTIPTRFRVSPDTILAVFGTVSFTFGGNAIFPTIQNDLKEPHKFPRAVVFGYCVVLALYTFVSVAAFLVFDTRIQEDLLTSFARSVLHEKCTFFRVYTTLAQVCICGHILAAFVIIINPVNQQIEYLLKIPVCKYIYFVTCISYNIKYSRHYRLDSNELLIFFAEEVALFGFLYMCTQIFLQNKLSRPVY